MKDCDYDRLSAGCTVLPQERERVHGGVNRTGREDGGEGTLDPQEARWHPRPDVIFWQSKPVISGITLYSWLRPHGHIYSRRCNSRWESLQRNSDSSLKSCQNICRGSDYRWRLLISRQTPKCISIEFRTVPFDSFRNFQVNYTSITSAPPVFRTHYQNDFFLWLLYVMFFFFNNYAL